MTSNILFLINTQETHYHAFRVTYRRRFLFSIFLRKRLFVIVYAILYSAVSKKKNIHIYLLYRSVIKYVISEIKYILLFEFIRSLISMVVIKTPFCLCVHIYLRYTRETGGYIYFIFYFFFFGPIIICKYFKR